MFIDETEIAVTSGRGGDGVVSFRHEKYEPDGGPDGGDGGAGGDVILRASRHINTLSGIQHRHIYKAENGRPGGGNQRSGKAGPDIVIELPVGTLVRDLERGHVLRDLTTDQLEFVIARGGDGGLGNRHFASPTQRTPRRATQGHPGETRSLRLELRLVADAGIVGLPNAGKSTLLRRVSAARPKVADYPFTTLEPVLGIATVGDRDIVLADIPGLIEGAHEGAGLGDRFLRHVARTRVLVHLVDASVGPEQAATDWQVVRSELRAAGLGLADKPFLPVVSRADLVADAAPVAAAVEQASGVECLILSASTGLGVAELLQHLARLLSTPEDVAAGKAEAEPPSKP